MPIMKKFSSVWAKVQVDVLVEFHIEKGCRGVHDRLGFQETPDEPDRVEIDSVVDMLGNKVDVEEFETDRILDDLSKEFIQ